jgi:RHS repeat-associated protein
MAEDSPMTQGGQDSAQEKSAFTAPQINLPKGGGAIRGIGEKFTANAATGTGSLSVPIALSSGRSGFGPRLSLTYDSGSGNGPFGIGWSLGLPAITRKTDKGLPRYGDGEESDVFILSGYEDLVPVLKQAGHDHWVHDEFERDGYRIKRYRPRIEGFFSQIERWTRLHDGDAHWRSISRDNILCVYGRTADSRISDPLAPGRVFSWLACECYDDKGNAIVYEYAAENPLGVDLDKPNERNRLRSANRYLKRVRYGNRKPLLLDVNLPSFRKSHVPLPELKDADWMFEAVFDYGDADYTQEEPDKNDDGWVWVRATPHSRPGLHWPVRKDPFSSYRSGFEMRTYRLCRRVLMFHHFPEELRTKDYLVRSTEFEFHEKPLGSFISRVVQSGFTRHPDGRYLKKSLPALDFAYTSSPLEDPHYHAYRVHEAAPENLPGGIDGDDYKWVDLNGEGISGVLTEQGDAWFYKPNAGHGRFRPTEVVSPAPSLAALSKRKQQLLDLDGDGNLNLVELSSPTPGFYERTLENSWGSFRTFRSLPVLDWDDPNLRFVDVTGDGIADVLVTEDDAFTWHPSLVEPWFNVRLPGPPTTGPGWGAAVRVPVPHDEREGPHVVFADGTQSIYLADMSGDGLSDIVRIRNGEVCYWPNTGYGTFGRKVTMDNSPWFEDPDLFDQKRIKLADTDGSGTTDILYLGHDGIKVFLNETGNGWSAARELPQFAAANDQTSVSVVDFLGRGTMCLLWSSSLPSDMLRPLRYLDLMNGQKPHLLTHVRNNLGAETRVDYASSTEFYLADRAAGTPWVTRLPFPVHVVKKVETYDYISRNRFVRVYSYHHGFFDGVEREFRGFGRVDQLDTEEFAALTRSGAFPVGENVRAESNVPPVLTKTWFHTGVFLGSGRVSRHMAHEYWREPGLLPAEQKAMFLDDTILPDELTPEEAREACRTLKGQLLRQEVYALDESPKSALPYTVSEHNYTLRLVQPRLGNRHAVLFSHPREAILFNYDRTLYLKDNAWRADPRVTHDVVLEADAFGNILKSFSAGYGRRFSDSSGYLAEADQLQQRRILITLTENRFTNAVRAADAYRTPSLAETSTYELKGLKPDARANGITNLFRFAELGRKVAQTRDAHHPLTVQHHQASPASSGPHRRLFRKRRTLYRSDSLDRTLLLGQLQPLALPGETYTLAFTADILAHVFRRPLPGRPPEDLLPNPAPVLRAGGYVDLDGDGRWWTKSGRIFFSPETSDGPARELAHAKHHFFLPNRFQDPFGNVSVVGYDVHDLNLIIARDPVGSTVHARNDYRILAPRLVTDSNGNRSEVAFDALGMVVGTAIMGKEGDHQGDTLEGFVADLSERTALAHIRDPLRDPEAILQKATTRLVYDLFAFERGRLRGRGDPDVVYALLRETHASDLEPGERSRIQHAFSYSDGFGRQVQKKTQAGSGAKYRWVGSGWTIFNNKGKPVRQYEPFFSASQHFQFASIVGVSPTFFYDPLDRLVATLHPNHAYEKVVFDPWRQDTFDANDTVLEVNAAEDPDIGDFIRRLPVSDYLPAWYSVRRNGGLGREEQAAAEKTAVHANTPAVAFLDTLGRPFLNIAQNRFLREGAAVEEHIATRLELDIEGNTLAIIDALSRRSMSYDYNLIKARIHQHSIDAGERWTLSDPAGKQLLAWDSRDHRLRTEYDELRRPTSLFVQTGHAREILAEKNVYGEGQPDDLLFNLRGKVHQKFDNAGILTNEKFDFKDNLLSSARRLLTEYKGDADWSKTLALENDHFRTQTTYDALNRPLTLATPDGSVLRPGFDRANLLERLDANLRGSPAVTPFVTRILYNAKRQRLRIEHGNGVRTRYRYDRLTSRLIRIRTARFPVGARLQDLRYTYDPTNNVTSIVDDAQQHVYFKNQVVSPSSEYVYDAIYRLIHAEGRELIGLLGQPQTTDEDMPRLHQPLPGDGQAMRRYRESYDYDPVGNILRVIHRAAEGNWTRDYFYDHEHPRNNRLTGTRIGEHRETYAYDNDGNMVRAPHLAELGWNFKDLLESTRRQVVNHGHGETTHYVYDSSGQRVRKVTDGAGGEKRSETIYLGGFELFRRYGEGKTVKLERETLHVMDDRQRIALVETKTIDEGAAPGHLPRTLFRYQFSNHLNSCLLEIDEAAAIISYEEYYPHGSTSYQAVRSGVEVSPKRYRYTGKERDEETGFYYFGLRYYMPWLGRWTSCDPAGAVDSTNLYLYCRCNPVILSDVRGTQPNPFVGLHYFDEALNAVDRFTTAVGDVASGAGDALVDLAKGAARTAVDPGGVALDIGHQMEKEYKANGGGFDGVVGAINVVNPAYMALVAGYETKQAWDRGDYRAVGKQGTNTVVGVVGTVGVAAGGAGLITRGLGLGAAATDAAAADAAAVDAASGTPKTLPPAPPDPVVAPKPPVNPGVASDSAAVPQNVANPATAADVGSAPTAVPGSTAADTAAAAPADTAAAAPAADTGAAASPADTGAAASPADTASDTAAAANANPPTPPTPPTSVPTEGIYEFQDQGPQAGGKTYVGQSGDIPKRLGQHVRSGRLANPGQAQTTAVPGGKFAREIAEQNRITDLGGIKGGNVSNKVNPIGVARDAAARQQGLKPVIR